MTSCACIRYRARMFGSLLLLGVLTVQGSAQQTIRIRVLSGKTGEAITNARVTIRAIWNYEGRDVPTTPNGNGYEARLFEDATIGLGNVTQSARAWNQYQLCAIGRNLNPIYPIEAVLATGIATPDTCSRKALATPKPGEIIFYVHRLSLWQRLRNSIGN
jgi:hypothetical protein